MGKETKNMLLIIGKIIGKVFMIFLIATIFLSLIAKAYDLGYQIFNTPAISQGEGYEVTFTVSAGDSLGTVARNLENAGLIKDKTVFKIQKFFYNFKIKSGTYKLSTSKSSKEILQILNDGPQIGEETNK